MMTQTSAIFVMLLLASSLPAQAAKSSQVDRDLKDYDEHVARMDVEFARVKGNSTNKDWVKSKITHMVDVDQYMRHFWDTPFNHHYSPVETEFFRKTFATRSDKIDEKNTADLKTLFKTYSWFTLSEFGARTNHDAWLLVQHADRDPLFQREILARLEKLLPSKETNLGDYAYLYDRVASSFAEPKNRKPQRYGTQGHCTGPGTWEPNPTEQPGLLDVLRSSVGLDTEAKYIASFKSICH
jgi:hypothetical protein